MLNLKGNSSLPATDMKSLTRQDPGALSLDTKAAKGLQHGRQPTIKQFNNLAMYGYGPSIMDYGPIYHS
jgi:hypothetical protein